MNEWDINFCNNLCYLRQVNGLSKKAMAEILGISLSTYRKLERCEETVRIYAGMISCICNHFQVSADDILLQNWYTEKNNHCDRMGG